MAQNDLNQTIIITTSSGNYNSSDATGYAELGIYGDVTAQHDRPQVIAVYATVDATFAGAITAHYLLCDDDGVLAVREATITATTRKADLPGAGAVVVCDVVIDNSENETLDLIGTDKNHTYRVGIPSTYPTGPTSLTLYHRATSVF